MMNILRKQKNCQGSSFLIAGLNEEPTRPIISDSVQCYIKEKACFRKLGLSHKINILFLLIQLKLMPSVKVL